VHEHNSKVPGDDSFNRPELQPLREAYAAGLFAWILGEQHKARVKLDKDRFPDFHAYRPGVRRAAEYREAAKRRAAGLPEELAEFDPVQDEMNASPAIAETMEKKASKHYSSAPYLLVYVNFWLFNKPQMSLEQFAELAKPWATKFPEIWLLWGANAIRCPPKPDMICATSLPKGMVA
jgi:hypothetical protein